MGREERGGATGRGRMAPNPKNNVTRPWLHYFTGSGQGVKHVQDFALGGEEGGERLVMGGIGGQRNSSLE